MAITSGSFSASFDKGLAQGNIESGGVAQNGPTEWNAKITAVATGSGVPVNNGPQQKS